MAIVEFNPDRPAPEDIQKIYDEGKAGIEYRFNSDLNPLYGDEFALLDPVAIQDRKERMLEELSLRSSFFLLAYIEILFRSDFVIRLESKARGRKDELTKMYREEYNPAKKIYSYPLTDFIFKKWKIYANTLPHSKEILDILRVLPQYFDFRNWMAHGRYWIFRESNYMRKYNYSQIQILLGNLDRYFGPYLKKKVFS